MTLPHKIGDDTGEYTRATRPKVYFWSVGTDNLLAEEVKDGTQTSDDVRWMLNDHLGTNRDIVALTSPWTVAINHRDYDAYGNLLGQSNVSYASSIGYTGRMFDITTGLQNNLFRWYDPEVGRWTAEDPIGFGGDNSNVYRYVGNHPTYAVDFTGLEETVFTAEGRVKGRAIEESLERTGALTQRPVERITLDGSKVKGVVDAVQCGKNVEVGPASVTGLPAKVSQAASADNADVILYRQQGKVPETGSTVEYVRLTYEQAKELSEDAKANNWSSKQIWDTAAKSTDVTEVQVSPAAAEYAGRLHLRGKEMTVSSAPATPKGRGASVAGKLSKAGRAAGAVGRVGCVIPVLDWFGYFIRMAADAKENNTTIQEEIQKDLERDQFLFPAGGFYSPQIERAKKGEFQHITGPSA